MPLPPRPADRPGRALLLLLLLAREAELPAEQVDGPAARALVARGLDRDPGSVRGARRAAAGSPGRAVACGPRGADRERPAGRPN